MTAYVYLVIAICWPRSSSCDTPVRQQRTFDLIPCQISGRLSASRGLLRAFVFFRERKRHVKPSARFYGRWSEGWGEFKKIIKEKKNFQRVNSLILKKKRWKFSSWVEMSRNKLTFVGTQLSNIFCFCSKWKNNFVMNDIPIV